MQVTVVSRGIQTWVTNVDASWKLWMNFLMNLRYGRTPNPMPWSKITALTFGFRMQRVVNCMVHGAAVTASNDPPCSSINKHAAYMQTVVANAWLQSPEKNAPFPPLDIFSHSKLSHNLIQCMNPTPRPWWCLAARVDVEHPLLKFFLTNASCWHSPFLNSQSNPTRAFSPRPWRCLAGCLGVLKHSHRNNLWPRSKRRSTCVCTQCFQIFSTFVHLPWCSSHAALIFTL